MGSLYIVRDTMTAVQEPKAGEPIKAGAAIQVKGRGRSVYSSFDCVDHFGAGFDYVVPRDPIDIVALCGARRYQVGGGLAGPQPSPDPPFWHWTRTWEAMPSPGGSNGTYVSSSAIPTFVVYGNRVVPSVLETVDW